MISKLNIQITLRAPFLTQSSAPMDYGIDAALARNQEDKLYIPGTLLIGNLRWAWEELKTLGVKNFQPDIDDWLGYHASSYFETGETSFLPKPKRLFMNDLVLTNRQEERNTSYRIRLDPKRGSVEKGAYIVTEQPIAPGEDMIFAGSARFLAHNEQQADDLIRHLEIGLKWILHLGANRNIGFGEMVGVSVKKIENTQSKNASSENVLAEDATAVYDLIIQPEAPFCISEHHINGENLFRSQDVIPGGVIKGTLASVWTTLLGRKQEASVDDKLDPNRPELCHYFEQLRITHAFPSTDSKRPLQRSLSVVKAGEHFYDIALCQSAGLIHQEAPAFAVDWKGKDYGKAEQIFQFGQAAVKRELRVHTAINSDKLRAEEGQLFAYNMIVPDDKIKWYARLDLTAVPESERPQVLEQLQTLIAQGLTGLSKTKTYVQIQILPANHIPPRQPSNPTLRDGVWILTLQTPALLCDPTLLTNNTSDNALHQAYAQVFAEMSEQSLELVRFFATQSLAGGEYLWKRFQYPQYQPYLLSDASSVFVLTPKPDKTETAQDYIEQWLQTGLPVPDWAIKKYQRHDKPGNHWQNCPYLPQNGYGEIAVNLALHWEKQAKKEKPK